MTDLAYFKDQVKDAVDLRDLFIREGVELRRVNGSSSKCLCPVHQEKTPSCHVYTDHWYCFGCQANGDHFDLLHQLHRMEFMEALRFLAECAGLQMPSMDPQKAAELEQRKAQEHSLRQVLELVNTWFRERLQDFNEVQQYCKDRGLTPADLETWQIGFAPQAENALKDWAWKNKISDQVMLDAGLFGSAAGRANASEFLYSRFKGRLMFPIYDHRGRLCGFSGRIIEDDAKTAKYLNTPETPLFRKSNLLFGLHHAAPAIAETNTAILVEGQMDVIACHRANIQNTVAPLGTAFTPEHMQLLQRYAERCVIAMDPDAAGHKAAQKIIETFNARLGQDK